MNKHEEDMAIVSAVLDETKEIEMDLPFENCDSFIPAGSRINVSDSVIDSSHFDATIVRYIIKKGQKARVVMRVPVSY